MADRERMSLKEVADIIKKMFPSKRSTCFSPEHDTNTEEEQVAEDLLIMGRICLKRLHIKNAVSLSYDPNADWCKMLTATLDDGSIQVLDYDSLIGHDDLENDAVAELEALGMDVDFTHVNRFLDEWSRKEFAKKD